MAQFCQVVNPTPTPIRIIVRTQDYRSIDLQPAEAVFIRREVCAEASLLAAGATITLVSSPRNDIAYGPAHERTRAAVYNQTVELYSWDPTQGWPTYLKTRYRFGPGAQFTAIGSGTIPGDPISIPVIGGQVAELIEWDPTDTRNANWKLLAPPRVYGSTGVSRAEVEQLVADGALSRAEVEQLIADGSITQAEAEALVAQYHDPNAPPDSSVTLADVEALIAQYHGPGTSGTVPEYFHVFDATDWPDGQLIVTQADHGLVFDGKPYEILVTDDQGCDLIVSARTILTTGDVLVTTDGPGYPGTITIR